MARKPLSLDYNNPKIQQINNEINYILLGTVIMWRIVYYLNNKFHQD